MQFSLHTKGPEIMVSPSRYYPEMRELIARSLPGASPERVYVFDHTIRESGKTNLNAEAGALFLSLSVCVCARARACACMCMCVRVP